MGDDERGEFLYKFVSRDVYVPGGDTSTLLDVGQLSVAVFADDQTGRWGVAADAGGDPHGRRRDRGSFSRMAASKVGATTMDRPEWVAVNPVSIEAYCCLTNNRNRGVKPNAGGDPTPGERPNPREVNRYGQIVRWRPENDDSRRRGLHLGPLRHGRQPDRPLGRPMPARRTSTRATCSTRPTAW